VDRDSERSGADDDLVVRRTRDGRGRIDLSDLAAEPLAAGPDGDDDAAVQARSGAVLHDGRRVPIPRDGLTLGGEGSALQIGRRAAGDVLATIAPTGSGHVVIDSSGGRTFVNGERLVDGERRPLARGDALVVGEDLLHYLPAGDVRPALAPITPVDAGRVRSRRQVLTIGRAPESDLVLDHPTVSRVHAVITPDATGAVIEDRGSATGVRVNGVPVQRTALSTGDQIAIGPFRIVFDGEELIERSPAQGLAIVAAGVYVDVPSGRILQPIDVQLRPGELVAVVGESGAGKSTLLKALAGVAPPTGGRILVGGEDVLERLTEIGYVPQFDTVHGQLTAREALDYAARLRLPADLSEAERRARIDEVLGQLDLGQRADVLVERLSGGQRKRAAVGIELLHQPGALFLDEPTTGLDPGLERRMMDLFRSLANGGQTVALVTHATSSLSLCDRVLVMGRGGVLCFDGSPAGALEAFGVRNFDEIYVELARGDLTQITRRAPSVQAPRLLPPVRGARPKRAVQHTFGHQTRVLASRYRTLLSRDRQHLRSALIQVPILGLLTALLFNSGVFNRPPDELFTAKSAQLLFLMVTVAMWLGSINAAREIVKERGIVAREMAIGVQVRAYLASKLVVLLALATAQTAAFAVIVLLLRPLHHGAGAGTQLLLILVVSSWLAVLLGLVVSAYAASEDQATGVIPLLLVPQLLFGGAIVAIDEMTAPMKVLAALIPARWAFAASGHTIDLHDRIAADREFSLASHYGEGFFGVSLPAFVLIAAVFAAALIALLIRLLTRPQPV
jgi:ABC-type multidrug transport system ATPase subunit